jgi:hypothetical protein
MPAIGASHLGTVAHAQIPVALADVARRLSCGSGSYCVGHFEVAQALPKLQLQAANGPQAINRTTGSTIIVTRRQSLDD